MSNKVPQFSTAKMQAPASSNPAISFEEELEQRALQYVSKYKEEKAQRYQANQVKFANLRAERREYHRDRKAVKNYAVTHTAQLQPHIVPSLEESKDVPLHKPSTE